MLATPGPPPAGAGFFAEAKWDGARGIARVHGGGVDLISRPGNNFCSRFPDLTESLAQSLGGHSAILDGEVIARDGHGRPSFARLQRRLRVQRPSRTLLSTVPASFCVYLDSSGID
jgi:bifunctional non-homologous end joining protein LigD